MGKDKDGCRCAEREEARGRLKRAEEEMKPLAFPANKQIAKFSPCRDAVEWLSDRTLADAWRDCQRGDWLLWLADRLKIERRLLVDTACDCAEPALAYVPPGERRPWWALVVARANADAAVSAATYATYAANAAADAAAATYASAASDAANAARASSLAHSADLVRARIPFAVIEEKL